MKNSNTRTRFLLYLSLILGLCFYQYGRSIWHPIYSKISGKRDLKEVYEQYGTAAVQRLSPHFDQAGVPFPPSKLKLIAVKEDRVLEVWSKGIKVLSYPFTAFSGTLGPKLKEGDRQIPEGVYNIEYLNPNSSYHLSIKIDYPNEFDRNQAQLEGRTQLGGDIFIHGKSVTIGCIPIGDTAIEELFTLVYLTGKDKVSIAIMPHDFRKHPHRKLQNQPAWLKDKYQRIEQFIQEK